MSVTPNMTIPGVNQGGVEAMLSSDGVAIPITIDGTRLGSSTNKIKITAPHLYARTTASPHKARPFMLNAVIANPTNTTNATVDIPDADAVKFKVGDSCAYYNTTTGALSAETKVISAIGAAGSGGAGETLITFTGVWTTPPSAGHLLCVADGTQLSANVVVVLEDIEFDGKTDALANGYISGVFKKSLVGNATYFDNSKAQNIQLVDIV